MNQPRELSAAAVFVAALVEAYGDRAHDVIDSFIDGLTPLEGAALYYDWELWARPKQLPQSAYWRMWGFLTGRGFGKTLALSRFINEEVETGRSRLICLVAQDEQSSIDIQVNGPSGLIATAPPWFKPQWEASALQLVWPNGARAYVRTPEVPGKIRGLEYDLSWISELQSWPVTTRDEAFSNVKLSTRLGGARIVWDSTAKRKHPILQGLVKDAKDLPEVYTIVRGTTHENAENLADGYVEDLERVYGGTSKGKEELLGELLDESENAIFRQAWITNAVRFAPDRYLRRVVSIDPAVTDRKGSDNTGIIEAAIGADGQAYVLSDRSGKHDVGKWAEIVLDIYVDHLCDLVIAETNKGGQLVVQNLRAAAKERKLNVVVIGKDETPPRRTTGIVYVREVYARGAKEDRAEPVATAYQRGRVSHVKGAELTSLEETLMTWEPSPNADSPGDLDALVHAVIDLLGLAENKRNPAGFKGIEQMGAALSSPQAPAQVSTSARNLSTLLGGRGSGRI